MSYGSNMDLNGGLGLPLLLLDAGPLPDRAMGYGGPAISLQLYWYPCKALRRSKFSSSGFIAPPHWDLDFDDSPSPAPEEPLYK